MISIYLKNDLALRDPVMSAALSAPGAYLWRIPRNRSESFVWCEAATDIIDAHDHVNSAFGLWLSTLQDGLLLAYCIFGKAAAIHGEAALTAIRAAATAADATLRKAMARLMASSADPAADRTPREQQVTELMVLGLSRAEIAADLGITLRTVSFHTENIKKKLGAKNLGQVIVKAAGLT